MLGRRDKSDAVCGIDEERHPRLHRLEDTGWLLDVSIIPSPTALCNQGYGHQERVQHARVLEREGTKCSQRSHLDG